MAERRCRGFSCGDAVGRASGGRGQGAEARGALRCARRGYPDNGRVPGATPPIWGGPRGVRVHGRFCCVK